MHTFHYKPSGTTFNYNSDMSGEVRIVNRDGTELLVPGEAIIALVAHYVLDRKIAKLENAENTEILGID